MNGNYANFNESIALNFMRFPILQNQINLNGYMESKPSQYSPNRNIIFSTNIDSYAFHEINSESKREEDEFGNEEHKTTYDIFGNAICSLREITPFSGEIQNDENIQSESTKKVNQLKNDQLSDSDDDSEWNGEKENHVPFGFLITPLKPKKKLLSFGTGSLGSRTYSNRSPLEDITPPISKHTSDRYSSKIERTLRYSATPKTNNERGNGGGEDGTNIKLVQIDNQNEQRLTTA